MSGPQKYRKLPVEIEAMQLTGPEDVILIVEWITSNGGQAHGNTGRGAAPWVSIATLEGVMRAGLGDFIICGVRDEFYPCKSDIFEATYKRVTS